MHVARPHLVFDGWQVVAPNLLLLLQLHLLCVDGLLAFSRDSLLFLKLLLNLPVGLSFGFFLLTLAYFFLLPLNLLYLIVQILKLNSELLLFFELGGEHAISLSDESNVVRVLLLLLEKLLTAALFRCFAFTLDRAKYLYIGLMKFTAFAFLEREFEDVLGVGPG